MMNSITLTALLQSIHSYAVFCYILKEFLVVISITRLPRGNGMAGHSRSRLPLYHIMLVVCRSFGGHSEGHDARVPGDACSHIPGGDRPSPV